jgi:acyl-CoA dehydrogenase
MSLRLDLCYERLQDEAAEVAAAAEPFAAEADTLSTVHQGVFEVLSNSRLLSLVIPAKYGGRFGAVDPLAICVVREVLMPASCHLDSLFAVQGIGGYPLAAGGSEELCERWLPKVASGEALAALGLTEPDAGSDLKGITTELVPDGRGLRLRGSKAFISNGGAAAFYSVLAREGTGYSMVLVPADSPGLAVTQTPELIAPHVLADLVFDDVPVAPGDRLGEPGEGFDLVRSTLSVFRVSVAGAALGVGQAALSEAARHAGARRQFGRPLAHLGAVADMLADSWAELEAARLLCYRAGELAREDPGRALARSSMAKLLATETAGRIVDRAVQILGRFGLVRGTKVERLYRQARPMRIYEGASEVLRLGIARGLLDEITGVSSGSRA